MNHQSSTHALKKLSPTQSSKITKRSRDYINRQRKRLEGAVNTICSTLSHEMNYNTNEIPVESYIQCDAEVEVGRNIEDRMNGLTYFDQEDNMETSDTIQNSDELLEKCLSSSGYSSDSEQCDEPSKEQNYFLNDFQDINCDNYDDEYESTDYRVMKLLQLSSTCKTMVASGSSLTLYDAITAIMSYVDSSCTPDNAINKLLELLKILLPDSTLPQTKNQLFDQFYTGEKPNRVYYCSRCKVIIQSMIHGSRKPLVDTKCPTCDSIEYRNSFLYINPMKSFSELYSTVEFHEHSKYYRQVFVPKRMKRKINIYADIYDGEIYMKRFHNKTKNRSNRVGFTFQYNTDGISPFKSSKVGYWPIYLVCNELPPNLRYKKEYKIFCGLWYGLEKPVFNLFFTPLASSMNVFQRGVQMNSPSGQTEIIEGFLYQCTLDKPAQAGFLCMNSYNGKCGCAWCIQTGEKDPTLNKFIYRRLDKDPIVRTVQGTHTIYKELNSKILTGKRESHIQGLKDVPIFAQKLDYWCMEEQVTIDMMHNLALGITKTLIKCWRSPKKRYAKCDKVSDPKWVEFNNVLLNQQPPSIWHRKVRSIMDYKYWKASECFNFLIYYTPLLKQVLSPKLYEHLNNFVKHIKELFGDNISVTRVIELKTLLKIDHKNFEDDYGETIMTINFHTILHIADCVKRHGPLWCYTAFPYEGYNYLLTQAIHGTKLCQNTIVRKMLRQSKIRSRIVNSHNDNIKDYCLRLTDPSYRKRMIDSIDVRTGSGTLRLQRALKTRDPSGASIIKYGRVGETVYKEFVCRGQLVEAKAFSAKNASNNHTIQLNSGRYCIVMKIYTPRGSREGMMDVYYINAEKQVDHSLTSIAIHEFSAQCVCVRESDNSRYNPTPLLVNQSLLC